MHRNDLGHQVVDVVSMQTKVSVEAIMSERGLRADVQAGLRVLRCVIGT